MNSVFDDVAIIIDGAVHVPPDYLKNYNIEVVNQHVIVNETELDMGSIKSSSDILKNASNIKNIKTTAPSVGEFLEAYEQAASKFSRIISLHLSSQLSGTFQSAKIAADLISSENPDLHVDVIDTRSFSIAAGLLVMSLIDALEEGLDPTMAKEHVKKVRETNTLFFVLNELRWLLKSGRVSLVNALLSDLVRLKPLVTLTTDGKIVLKKKIWQYEKAINELSNLTVKYYRNKTRDARLIVGHVQAVEVAEKIEQYLLKHLEINKSQVLVMPVDPVFAIFSGPGAIGIAGVLQVKDYALQ